MDPQASPGLVDGIDAPVIAVDPELRFAVLNEAGERWLGRSRQRMQGKQLVDAGPVGVALHPLALEVRASGLSRTLALPPSLGGGRAMGSPWWEGDSIVGVVICVAPSVAAAVSELDVGALAAGLAHEVRNPLAAIRGAAELLKADGKFDASLGEYVQLIVREAARIDALVGRVMEVGKPQRLDRARFVVADFMHDLAIATAAFAKEAGIVVEVRETFDPALPPLVADRDRLFEALVNLARNAVQATRGAGGHIDLEALFDPDHRRLDAKGKGASLLRIVVRDDGPGLGDARDKLFTPFYSTKSAGTGLGLLLARKVVETHGGRLELRDRIPSGTGAEAIVLVPFGDTDG